MTGKVYKESTDIYQDQAHVLFDYYKKAAEKIVAEETACEREKKDLEQKLQEAQGVKLTAEKKAETYKILTFVLIVTVIGWIITFLKRREQLQIAEDAERAIQKCYEDIAAVDSRFNNIRRDYSVDKIGVVYVPIATRVPFGEKSFLIDHTGAAEGQSFQLPLLHQPEAFQESVQSLQEATEKLPIVEGNEEPEEVNTADYSLSVQNVVLHDYVGNIDRQIRSMNYLLSDSNLASVEIPAIDPKSDAATFIKEHATTDPEGKPVVEIFSADFDDKLAKLTQIEASKEQFKLEDGTDSVEYMKQLMVRVAENVQLFTNTKNAGTSALLNYTSNIFSLVLKAGYTQYSPVLEADEIERIRTANFDYQTSVNDYTPFNLKRSSQVRYDLFGGSWVAEDGSRTSMPFGIQQVDEEVLQPVIEALMAENRIERQKIYADVENQKRVYLERWSSEIGNYFRDNRAACDELINRMRDTYADYAAAYSMYQSIQATYNSMKGTGNALEGTEEVRHNLAAAEVQEVDTEAEMIAGFEKQAEECNAQQEQFSDYMDRIQESINDMTDSFSHIEYYEASLRDGISHDTAVAMAGIHKLDKRQRSLLGVSPYLASYGKLPPEPNVTDAMMDDIQIDLHAEAVQKIKEVESGDIE